MPINVQEEYEEGFYVGPTIFDLDEVELCGNIVWEEEIFGPVLCVKSFETEEEGFLFLFLFLFLFFINYFYFILFSHSHSFSKPHPFSPPHHQSLHLANNTIYGLAGAIFSTNPQKCQKLSRLLRVGCLWINCSQPNFVHAPWGGYKESGAGRELGPWGLGNYLEVKQVCECVGGFTWECYVKKG